MVGCGGSSNENPGTGGTGGSSAAGAGGSSAAGAGGSSAAGAGGSSAAGAGGQATFSITSPAFTAGGAIPKEYTCDGRAFPVSLQTQS